MKGKVSTPVEIEVLLHYVISLDPHPRSRAPVVEATTKKFLSLGIFAEDPSANSGICVTPMGFKFLEMILDTPYPIHKWVDPRVKE